MFEKFFKKQEKVQEKVQKQQELNDKDCELTDEELEQIVGGEDDFDTVITTAGEPDSAGRKVAQFQLEVPR